MIKYRDNILAIPPGETVKEWISYNRMSKLEFSRKVKLPLNKLYKLLEGKCELTYYMAFMLYRVTGVSVKLWLNLERNYRETILKISERR